MILLLLLWSPVTVSICTCNLFFHCSCSGLDICASRYLKMAALVQDTHSRAAPYPEVSVTWPIAKVTWPAICRQWILTWPIAYYYIYCMQIVVSKCPVYCSLCPVSAVADILAGGRGDKETCLTGFWFVCFHLWHTRNLILLELWCSWPSGLNMYMYIHWSMLSCQNTILNFPVRGGGSDEEREKEREMGMVGVREIVTVYRSL